MKPREYTTTGTITNDGKLKMFMGELNQFLAQFPGEKIIASFSVLPGEQSEALKAYYWKCVVPTMQKALWDAGERKDYIDTDVWIREQSPIMAKQDYKNGRIETEIKTIDELSNAELIEHIETVKQLAAEEFSVFMEDPKN